MTPAEDMLEALQYYYSIDKPMRYNEAQRAALLEYLGASSKAYVDMLYDEVVAIHETRFRSLPDLAVLRQAAKALDRPEVYQKPVEVPLLPEPERAEPGGYTIDDGRELAYELVTQKRGNMSRQEKWWLMCRVAWKQWRPMPEEWDMDWRECLEKCGYTA